MNRAYAVLAALLLGLTACGDGAAPTADPTSPAVVSSTPTTAAPEPEVRKPAPTGIRVVVGRLPDGPPPRVDVLVDGTLLFHEGRAIEVSRHLSRPLGSFEGRTYAVEGDQLVVVDDDGSLTGVGRPHPTYNHFPQLVRETGHVLMIMQNRNGPGVLWVVDARTGEDVGRVRGNDFGDLEPADRELAELWAGGGSVDRPAEVAARSADGAAEVVTAGDRYASRQVLTLRRTGGGAGTSFLFPASEYGEATVLVEQVAVESARSFVALVSTGPAPDGSLTSVVVRCRSNGQCERVTPVGEDVQVAGSGSDVVLAEPTD
ncbi:MAG: hypothetical protein JWN84_897 [Nocardioides sp.]|jgi:hypothetical protein|nr:hypothetical protein [Nocardioides sp.]